MRIPGVSHSQSETTQMSVWLGCHAWHGVDPDAAAGGPAAWDRSRLSSSRPLAECRSTQGSSKRQAKRRSTKGCCTARPARFCLSVKADPHALPARFQHTSSGPRCMLGGDDELTLAKQE
jgi:hypothetical protein